ncbi:MAG TPA: hypothetical protein DIW61_01270 [Candidatus Aminicenantes bacterium]|nr:hypothetical protein [Candidatus Aminicenantes bacterium]
MSALDHGYSAEIDSIDKAGWEDLMARFEDASYHQTWSFGALHAGEKAISHLVLKTNGQVTGMAQARLLRFPGLRIGLAYVSSGPMYRIKGVPPQPDALQNLLRALCLEYVLRRGYFLRVLPNKIDSGEDAAHRGLYEKEGYSLGRDPRQTVIVDLSRSLDEIRKNMDRKWRQTLQAAERRHLALVEGDGEEIYEMAMKLIGEMKNRKGFLGGNQGEALRVHRDLPPSQRLRFLVCVDEQEPVAVLGWTTTGSVGLPLVAATGTRALKTNASYVLWWKMIEYYKANGFLAVDMGGINQKRNPGGYYFKTHILGKRLHEQPHYLGPFDACNNGLSRLFFIAANQTRQALQDVRALV